MSKAYYFPIFLLFFTFSSQAVVPPGYHDASPQAKQEWHRKMALQTPSQPNRWIAACFQVNAMLGAISRNYLSRTVNAPSGYPEDGWRQAFGKAVHNHGVTAPATLELKEPFLGLEPGSHPLTIRFSLATPRLPLAPYRPGFLVMIHRDGKEDLNLFVMPSKGLNGFRQEHNPFSYVYTNWLEKPGTFIRLLARLTFQRVVADPYTQYLPVQGEPTANFSSTRDNSVQLLLQPSKNLKQAYDTTPAREDFRTRLAGMEVDKDGTPLFQMTTVINGNAVPIGNIDLLAPWISSYHSDMWFAQHFGFTPRH